MMKRLLLCLAACGDGVHNGMPDARDVDAPPDVAFVPDAPPPRLCGDGLQAPHEVCAQLMTFDAPGVRAAHLVGTSVVYIDATGIQPSGPLVDAQFLAIGDLDHDGITDLVTAGGNSISAWRGTGTGYVAAGTYLADETVTGLGVGNTDGLPGDEIAFTDANHYTLLHGDLSLLAMRQSGLLVGLAMGDANGDGYVDGLAIYRDPDFQLGHIEKSSPIGISGAEGFSPFVDGALLAAVAAGDLDGDGQPELLVGQLEPADILACSQRDGISEIPGVPRVQLMATGHLGAAGRTDLVMSSHDPEALTVVSAGDRFVEPIATIPLPAAITGLTIDGDMNGDGRQDPVVVMADQIGVLMSRPY